jgi:hypothetical protein
MSRTADFARELAITPVDCRATVLHSAALQPGSQLMKIWGLLPRSPVFDSRREL